MLTLIIVTRNRAHYLEKLLSYYAFLNLKYPLLIGDSSDTEEAGKNRVLCDRLKSKLSVSYFHFPHDPQCGPSAELFRVWYSLLDKVQTPYTVHHPDDDFFNPSCLEKCVAFLESNSDYSAAHGFSLVVMETDSRVVGTGKYPQPSNEEKSSSERLLRSFTVCSSMEFSVKRTEQVREALGCNIQSQFATNHFMELLNSGFTAVHGKIKKLDQLLHMVRRIHSQSISSAYSRDVFKWITHSKFSEDWNRFSDILSVAMAKRDQLSQEESKSAVKKAFWAYLKLELNSKWHGQYGQNHTSKARLKRWGRGIPFLKQTRDQIYSFLPQGKSTLPALLKKNSPYHEDFMPIYRAIEGRLA